MNDRRQNDLKQCYGKKLSKTEIDWDNCKAYLGALESKALMARQIQIVHKIQKILRVMGANNNNPKVLKSIKQQIAQVEQELMLAIQNAKTR